MENFKEDALQKLENIANMLRGMMLDPACPRHMRQAMLSKIEEVEAFVEENLDE